jgi:serine protease Do
LGIQDVNNENLAQYFGLPKTEGILVTEVTPGSPAEKAGFKQGDVILSFNGSPLADVSDLRNRVALTAPGSSIMLNVIRNSRRKQVQVVIGEQPADFSRRAKIKMQMQRGSLLEKLGMQLQELTPELAAQFGYRNGQGVIVAEVEQGSPADNVGIEPGQLIEEVNQVRVHNLSELKNALSKGKSSEQVLLRIRTGEFSKYVALKYQEDDE